MAWSGRNGPIQKSNNNNKWTEIDCLNWSCIYVLLYERTGWSIELDAGKHRTFSPHKVHHLITRFTEQIFEHLPYYNITCDMVYASHTTVYTYAI